ncbi:MAG TPA: DNA polymerase III subunit beta, partial [Clostridia bacterium]|nr:DNA polymerase III subunit beta [Clostridia bacterium]
MELSCNKKDLAEAVSTVQRAVSTKSSLPALEGILIKASEHVLTLSAYDLELGISKSISASVSQPGEIVLNARIFADMVKKLPAEQVELKTDEKLLTTVNSGNSEFTFLGIPSSEFPEIPSLTDGTMFTLPQSLLSSMIRQTLFAVSSDDTKPIHTGSLFEIDNGVFNIVSVDGYRLA